MKIVKGEVSGEAKKGIREIIARRCGIGYTTGGHTGEAVYLGVYAPSQISGLEGTVDNTEVNKYMQDGKLDNTSLEMEKIRTGYVKTTWANGPITDSAPAASALSSGYKTNPGVVGLTTDSIPKATILEAAELSGKSTGIVATSEIMHATPAGFTSHANDPSGTIGDILAFDDAVKYAVDYAKEKGDTIVIVTTDHGNSGFSIGNATTTVGYDNITIDEINLAKSGKVNKVLAARAKIGYTTLGHTGGNVYLGVYAPASVTKLKGIVDNTELPKYLCENLGLDLDAASNKLFGDIKALADKAFRNKKIQ